VIYYVLCKNYFELCTYYYENVHLNYENVHLTMKKFILLCNEHTMRVYYEKKYYEMIRSLGSVHNISKQGRCKKKASRIAEIAYY
jgi:hypothetical protein